MLILTRHAPRERVSWNDILLNFTDCISQSRSTWACELKCKFLQFNRSKCSHAPRERVSWNAYIRRYDEEIMRHAPRERVSWNNQDSRGERVAYVTLHVSVWVEIIVLGLAKFKSMSRSTWACELKSADSSWPKKSGKSRSTWACELKSLQTAF